MEHLQATATLCYMAALSGDKTVRRGDTGARGEEHLQAPATLCHEAALSGDTLLLRGDTGARSARRRTHLVEHHSSKSISRHWRTRSIFPSLSPVSFTPGRSLGHGVATPRSTTRSLHQSAPARGEVLYTDSSSFMAEPGLRTRGSLAMHRTQRPASTKKMTKPTHNVVAFYKLRRSPYARVGLPPHLKVMSGLQH